MSDTPRTDDREFAAIDVKPSSRVVYASLARQLETELVDKDKRLAEARADADHWKSECNALQRMVHEARAEIEMLKHQLEDESMRADGMTTAHAEACAKNYRQQELIEQMREALRLTADEYSLHVSRYENRNAHDDPCYIAAEQALAAERG